MKKLKNPLDLRIELALNHFRFGKTFEQKSDEANLPRNFIDNFMFFFLPENEAVNNWILIIAFVYSIREKRTFLRLMRIKGRCVRQLSSSFQVVSGRF